MNASGIFDAGRGGWNDSDFKVSSSSQYRSAISGLENIPIPVTIETLKHFTNGDEKLCIDNYSFSTVFF